MRRAAATAPRRDLGTESLQPVRIGLRPSEPFGSPRLPARGSGPGEALAGALRDQVPLDLGEQREERGGHDLGLDVALADDADVLLERHEGDPGFGEGVEDGPDLTERPTEPGDQAVAALQDARQLIEPPAFLGRLVPEAVASMKYGACYAGRAWS